MADTILILGNGFDLAQKRKTSYTDFLEFLDVVYIFKNYNTPGNKVLKEGSANSKKDLQESARKREEAIKNNIRDFLSQDIQIEGQREGRWIKENVLNESYYSLNFIVKLLLPELCHYVRTFSNDDKANKRREEFNNFVYPRIVELVGIGDSKNVLKNAKDFLFSHQNIVNILYLNQNKSKVDGKKLYDVHSWKFLNNIDNNLILKFVRNNKSQLGQDWSSLELIISNLAEAISEIKQKITDYSSYFEMDIIGLNKAIGTLRKSLDSHQKQGDDSVQSVIEQVSSFNKKNNIKSIDINTFANKSNPMAYIYVIEQIRKEYKSDRPIQSIIDEVNDKFVSALEELTNWLEFYLTYLDELDKDKEKVTGTVLDKIVDIELSKVINFNYTDTIKRFGIKEENIHFIHGRLNFGRRNDEINTMVFGIEDRDTNRNEITAELVPYQKFYQRVVKETGNDFEEYFKAAYTDDHSPTVKDKNIIIYGHSVDPLDKEIFQKCFKLAKDGSYGYRFIFVYYNEYDKRSIARNLAIILGKHDFISLSGKKKIAFVRWNDKKKMKTLLLP